jgi:hypothetical protein
MGEELVIQETLARLEQKVDTLQVEIEGVRKTLATEIRYWKWVTGKSPMDPPEGAL